MAASAFVVSPQQLLHPTSFFVRCQWYVHAGKQAGVRNEKNNLKHLFESMHSSSVGSTGTQCSLLVENIQV